ncbi:MAG: ROK family protein [Alphaproteobacteria bacterium]
MRIGVDLGGTKIEVVALDDGGRELVRRRRPTPADDYEAIIDAVAALVAEAERELGAEATVGVGVPGSPSPVTGLMRNANTRCLNGRPLACDLAWALRRPARLANDANCLAISEARDGAGAGARVVFAVILGTGVGGGLVVDGALVTGANGIAGEWGHNPLPWPARDEWPGPRCWCGRDGCIETFLSGPALAMAYGGTVGADVVAERSDAGEAAARAVMNRYVERLARALAAVINLLDPDVVVLAGGLSNIDRLTRDVPRLWKRWVFSDVVGTKLVRARHGDSSGVRGAAWLWP